MLTIDISGYEAVLTAATEFHNTQLAQGNEDFKPITEEAYLQELVIRQLEGLALATGAISTQRQTEFARSRNIKARNLAINKDVA